MPHPLRSHHAGIFALCLLLTGCSAGDADRPEPYPVSGRVLLDGRPLAEARVVLHSVDSSSGEFPTPLAFSDDAGNFSPTTYATRDGAPAGEYVVTVELRDIRIVADEPVRDGRNILPARYASPDSSPFRCTVTAQENELPPFELTSR